MDYKRTIRRAAVFNFIIALLALIGAVQHWGRDGLGMLQYYTYQSNMMLLWACAVGLYYDIRILTGRGHFVPSWALVLKYLAVCTVVMTFAVVVLVLAPMIGFPAGYMRLLFSAAQMNHHLWCPLLGLFSLLHVDKPDLGDRRLPLWAASLTLLYAVLATACNVLGIIDGPYPFLRVTRQPLGVTILWYIALLGLAYLLAWLVWRRLRATADRRVPSPAVDESPGWSADGFIVDQDCFSTRRYRTLSADNNSCGPIAAFNLRHACGHDVDFADVLAEMEGMHLLNIPGPTYMRVMRKYMTKHLPGWREAKGREAGFRDAQGCTMAVFRYWQDRVPHFVACVRQQGGRYRFFNVKENMTDHIMTLDDYRRDCCCEGPVDVLYWEETK